MQRDDGAARREWDFIPRAVAEDNFDGVDGVSVDGVVAGDGWCHVHRRSEVRQVGDTELFQQRHFTIAYRMGGDDIRVHEDLVDVLPHPWIASVRPAIPQHERIRYTERLRDLAFKFNFLTRVGFHLKLLVIVSIE